MKVKVKEFEAERASTNPIIWVRSPQSKARKRVLRIEEIEKLARELIEESVKSKRWERAVLYGGTVPHNYRYAAKSDYAFILAFPTGVAYVWHVRDYAFKTPWGCAVSNYRVINRIFPGCAKNFCNIKSGKELRPKSPMRSLVMNKRKIIDLILTEDI